MSIYEWGESRFLDVMYGVHGQEWSFRISNGSENPPGVFYPLEERIDIREEYSWLVTHWYYSFYISAIYIALTIIGERIMRDRQRFDLTIPLFLWNCSLAIFSLWFVIRGTPYAIYDLTNIGFIGAVCDGTRFNGSNKMFDVLGYVFAMSKGAEFFDTLFIILRKQPLLFLHRYHHVTVFIYAWHCILTQPASAKLFCLVNAIVHTAMYTYFALKTIKVPLIRLVSLLLTAGQISQMALGCFTNLVTYVVLSRGERCDNTFDNLFASLVMYFSYLVLFTNFFIQSYITGVPLSSYWKNSYDDKAQTKKNKKTD